MIIPNIPKRWRSFVVISTCGLGILVIRPESWRLIIFIIVINFAVTAFGDDE